MNTYKGQCLDIVDSMTTRKLVEKAQRVVIVRIRPDGKIVLRSFVGLIPGTEMEKHNGEHHVHDDKL